MNNVQIYTFLFINTDFFSLAEKPYAYKNVRQNLKLMIKECI